MMRPLLTLEKSIQGAAAIVGIESVSDLHFTGISFDSKAIQPGDIFCAFPGLNAHGADFAVEAEARGAVAILTDAAGAGKCGKLLPLIVPNPRRAAALLSAWFYDDPMRAMFSVGITGTNGKTTTTMLLNQLWQLAGRESGLIGTVETRIGVERLASSRTTPEAPELQALVATMRERHVRDFVMEVSSHSIALERVRGSHFNVVGFTNLTQEHLDFHGDMESYFNTKRKIFTFEFADLAVINIDSTYGAALSKSCEIPQLTLSNKDKSADWHYVAIDAVSAGYQVAIRGRGGILIETLIPLHGDYNLENALMAIAIATESGMDPIDIARIVPALNGAPGRLQQVAVGQSFTALVDYAHSPDAVERVLATARKIAEARSASSKVIAVLGCGGDRDATKRAPMGKALLAGSDIAIFTSDNPRSESAEEILEEMCKGLTIKKPHQVIVDRRKAIESAVALASGDDILLVLGKGHEVGQEIYGVIHPFDDRVVLGEAIAGVA